MRGCVRELTAIATGIAVSFAGPVLAQVRPRSATANATSTSESPAAAAWVARARNAEATFLMSWRTAWQDHLAANSSMPRMSSLHCHADHSDDWVSPHIITTPFSRKSMCPIWYNVDDGPVRDESNAIDNALAERDRLMIRAARADVLDILDSAAVKLPGDGWITGQRVRLYVDQGQFDRAGAIARKDCALSASYCAMLAGFVLESSGDRSGANAAYAYAVTQMADSERCAYLDIRPFIDKKYLDAYESMRCGERDKVNTRFWWLADPLFSDQWNDRLTVQLYRQTIILLHSALTADERFDWRNQFGAGATAEMILRYGWPSFAYWDRWEDAEHFKWLGFSDSSTNASLEYALPRFHTTPAYEAAADPAALDPDDWRAIAPKWNARRGKWDDDWWAVEHFARSAPLIGLDNQTVFFRRKDSVLVALATVPDPDLLPDSVLSTSVAALIATGGPTDSARHSVAPARRGPAGTVVMSVMTVPGHQILSGEIAQQRPPDGVAGRARFGITAPPGLAILTPGQLAVSGPLFFQPPPNDGDLPSSADDAMSRMLGSRTIAADRVGVFWELYGLPASDTVDLTLTITSLDRPSLLRRIGSTLGIIGEDGGTVSVKWREPQPGARGGLSYAGDVPIQVRAVTLDISKLRTGRYSVQIAASRPGALPVSSTDEIRIKR